MDYIKF